MSDTVTKSRMCQIKAQNSTNIVQPNISFGVFVLVLRQQKTDHKGQFIWIFRSES